MDFGKKRTGVAVTDPSQIIAGGLTTVRTSELIDFLKDYLSKESVEKIVIGQPRTMDYEYSESMSFIEPFVNKLKSIFSDLPIVFFDERFTSVMAHQAMVDSGIGKKKRQNKALVDQISATIILQGYMESLRLTI